MKANILIIRIMSMIAMLGWGVQPSLADPEQGYTHAYSSEQGCGEERTGNRAHPADHLRHLLQQATPINSISCCFLTASATRLPITP